MVDRDGRTIRDEDREHNSSDSGSPADRLRRSRAMPGSDPLTERRDDDVPDPVQGGQD